MEQARLTPPGGPIFSLALDSREQDGLPNQVRPPAVGQRWHSRLAGWRAADGKSSNWVL